MRGEVFALTPPLRGFSLTASSCRPKRYHLDPLLAAEVALVPIRASVASATRGGRSGVAATGGLDLTSGWKPGRSPLRSEQRMKRSSDERRMKCHAITPTKP